MKKKSQLVKPEDVRLVIKLLVKNWYIILIIPALGALLGYYNSYKLPDIYRAETEILLKSEKLDYKSQLYQGLFGYDAYAQQTNQKRVLSSYDLISEVVRKLGIEVSYFRVGRLRKTDMYKSSPFLVNIHYLAPQLYEVPLKVKFSKDHYSITYPEGSEEKEVNLPYSSYVSTDLFAFYLQTHDGKPVHQLASLPGEFEVVVHRMENLINHYRGSLQVSGLDYTSIITLAIEDQVVQRALDFLDSLNVSYSSYTVREKLNINQNTISFIEKQLEDALTIINSVESELETYKSKESIFNLNNEESIYYEKLLTYDDEIKKMEMRLNTIKDLEQYITRSKSENLLPPSFYIPEGDDYLTKTLAELYNMQQKKITDLYDLKEPNPLVKKSDRTFELIKRDMLSYLNNTKIAINEKIIQLGKMTRNYEALLRSLPKAQRDIINIERKIEINEKLYNYLLEQRANVIIEKATIVPENEVIDSPRSQGVVRPNRKSIINNYLLGGVILSIGIVALRFFFFDKYESPSELKSATDIPVIGGIPQVKDIIPYNTKNYIDSDLAESIRRIRTNLQFMGTTEDKKVILVTSMFPSEGKTFTSVNLAYLNALTDKKVLLVDFDMHKPNVHKTIKIGNAEGLSLLLSGRKTEYEDILTAVHPNLDVLTAGPVPPNASELVMGDKVKLFMDRFKDKYDMIILDTPPLHLITDARILMAFADISLMIINVKNATKSNISDIEEFNEENVAKNFALVLNGVKIPRWHYIYSKYDYKYAYKYGYAYGYGYGYKYGKDI